MRKFSWRGRPAPIGDCDCQSTARSRPPAGPTKKGACKGHKGVKDWYAEPAAATTPPAPAAAAATPPAGSTGLCNDGTYYSGPTKKGACKGHKGAKDWYAAPAAAAASATPAAAPATSAVAAKPAAVPATSAAATPATASPPASTAPKVAAAPAPGGGAGKVWVNKSTKVYHCPGDKWYGKTKEGEYMSGAEAASQGAKPDHGKACK
jgi:hypothetical protein